MKWKTPLYIVGIGALAAGAFGVGVYSSGEVNKTYQKVQESVSCLYSAENCPKQDKIETTPTTSTTTTLIMAEPNYAAKVSQLQQEVKALQQKLQNVDAPQVDVFSQLYQQPQATKSTKPEMIIIAVPIDALLARLGKDYQPGTSSYRSFTDKIKEFCVEKTFEEGKKELDRKIRETHESIDQMIDSTTSFLGDKANDYRRRLSDAIYPEASTKSEPDKPEDKPIGGN